MREARIKCLCRSLRLPDLKLILVKGQEVSLAEGLAVASGDLATAVRIKAVQVRYVTICTTQREPPDTTLRVGKLRPPVLRPKVPLKAPQALPEAPPATLTTQVLNVDVNTGAVVQEIMDKLLAKLATLPLGSVALGAQQGIVDEPLHFIPSGMVPEGTEDSVLVKAEESNDEAVARATAALRKRKGLKTGKKT